MSNFLKKYKKDGVELNYRGMDSHQVLVREVVGEAIKILNMYDRNCKISQGMAMMNCKKFLRVNFSLDEMTGRSDKSNRSDAWRIEQYNRNRAPIDHIDSVESIDSVEDIDE